MKLISKLSGAILALGLASCSLSPSAQAQVARSCGPAEISSRVPEFQPLWKAVQQRLWAFQDEMAASSDAAQLNRMGLDVVDSIEAMSKLRTDALRCIELEAFLFRTLQAGADLKAAIERSNMSKAKAVASAIAQDFPFAADARPVTNRYLGSVPYWGRPYYGGYGHYSWHSHHHHHH